MPVFIRFLVLISLSISIPLQSAQLQVRDNQSQMMHDLEMMEHLFGVSYAPVAWKEELFGLSLNQEFIRMRDKIASGKISSIKEYQEIVKEFTFLLKDYHVTASFYSTEYAALPINIQSAEGRFFITKVKEGYFSHTNDKNIPAVGDEVVTIDGRPVAKVFEEFRSREIGDNVKETDQALAELYMTKRMGSLGHVVPKGNITFEMIRKGTAKKYTYKDRWSYYSEKVPSPVFAKCLHQAHHGATICRDCFEKLFITSHYLHHQGIAGASEAALDYFGARNGVLPRLGTDLWKTSEENYFDAYLFKLPNGKKAGYLRIPTYLIADSKKVIEDFEKIIIKFESEATVLVIDQMNNPGGYVTSMYALASRLTPYALYLPKHRIMLTQQDVYYASVELDYFEMMETEKEIREYLNERMDGVHVSRAMIEQIRKYHGNIINHWKSGRRFTDFESLYGLDELAPHPKIRFTKPLLMLVNSLDFSAGDFMPAIMQDNNRAVIIGSRTAGAGGYIEELAYPNLCGVQNFCLTASFAERPNHQPIENLGVVPDIQYTLTVNDLRDKYCDYTKRIIEELTKLTK